MTELHLPHQNPIRFAQDVISKDDSEALVKVKFSSIPTLAMIIEAAAQSSAAFGNNEVNMGFLVSLKNIKLLNPIESLNYNVKIINEHNLNSMKYFNFELLDNDVLVASGSFVVAFK